LVADRLRVVPRSAVICNPPIFKFAGGSHLVTKEFFWPPA
jgi:hypothetical protein